jgi:hypothetical protein
LRHAAHETEHDIRAIFANIGGKVLHFADGLLLRKIADASGVQQNHVGEIFRFRERIALGDKLGGDGLAVALVHLATIGFYENSRHFSGNQDTPDACC